MSWALTLQRILGTRVRPRPALPEDDAAFIDRLITMARDEAERAARVQPEGAEELLKDIVIGNLTARLEERWGQHQSEMSEAAASSVEAQHQCDAIEREVAELRDTAEVVDASDAERRAAAAAAEANVELRAAEQDELPLLMRIGVGRIVSWVALLATAAGFGALVRLSLEGVDDITTKWALIVAAVGTALSAELLVGTMGADRFRETPPEGRRRFLSLTLLLVFGLLVTTEAVAVLAREAGADMTNGGPQVNPDGNLTPGGGGFTPSLLWTMPLAILITFSGAGIVGLNRLREAGAHARDALEDARAAKEVAEARVRDEAAKAESMRALARERQTRSAQISGKAASGVTEAEGLLLKMQRLAPRYEGLAQALTAQALLTYRVAAERERERERASRPSGPVLMEVAASSGLALLLGAAVVVAGGSTALALMIGSGTLLVALLVATMRVHAR
jgi:hypothetical protein